MIARQLPVPGADRKCPACRGRGTVVAERWAGFKVRAICSCVESWQRKQALAALEKEQAQERAKL